MMSTPHAHTHVDVLLSACDREDADAVFGTLESAFPETAAGHGPSSVRTPDATASGHPTVWSLDVDASAHGAGTSQGPVALGSPVTADLSGDPHHVREVEHALAESFRVQERGRVSGDQELDVRLRLSALPQPS